MTQAARLPHSKKVQLHHQDGVFLCGSLGVPTHTWVRLAGNRLTCPQVSVLATDWVYPSSHPETAGPPAPLKKAMGVMLICTHKIQCDFFFH